MQLTRMFELSTSAAPPKRSVLKWLAAGSIFLGVCFMLAARGYILSGTLFVLAGNVFITLETRQKKETKLPHLSLQ
jgi:hypothetical protein